MKHNPFITKWVHWVETTKAVCLGAALVLPLVPATTSAQSNANPAILAASSSPSGSFQYEIRADGGPALWNFSGSYSLPYYNTLRLHQDARGTITAFYETGDTASAVLLGTIKGAGSDLKMRLRSTMAFPEFSFEYFSWVMRKDQMLLTFDPSARTLTGSDRVRRTREETIYYTPNSFWEGSHTKVVRHTYSSIQPVALAAPESTDGNWTLHLDIVSTANKLSGTGSTTFSNGEVFQFQLFGSYAPKTQKTKLVLRGTGDDKGATLMLSLAGPEMNIESLRGRVGGQRLRFP